MKGRALCNGLEQVTSQGSITRRNRSTRKCDYTQGTPARNTGSLLLGRKHGRARLGLTDAYLLSIWGTLNTGSNAIHRWNFPPKKVLSLATS